MYSSRFYSKRFIIIIILLTPLTVIANLQTQNQQLQDIYILDDNEEALGALPLLDDPNYPDFVEQTYPIDDHYGEAKKG